MTKHLYLTVFLFLVNCFLSYSQAKPKPAINCKYLLYLPVKYFQTEDKYPVIIYLHGASARGNDLTLLKKYGLPFFIDKGFNYEFIIASPQCPANLSWTKINWFDSLFFDLSKNYRIDKKRVYVIGMSMGGYGAWHAALDYPDKIAAIIPICGGCNDSLNICHINNIPVWTFHGSADKDININETERLVKRLENCQGKIKYTRLDNYGHDISYLFKNSELYEWLKKQKKRTSAFSSR